MGEIQRFDFEMHNYGDCDMCYGEIEEAEDGEYIEYEDHLKAIAEAKKEGAREILNKALLFECKEIDCSNCLEENDIVCAMNSIVRTYGVDEVIKKVEGRGE